MIVLPKSSSGGSSVIGASATVDNNTGVPSVEVALSEGNLNFDFKNLKGAKGDTGAAGSRGPAGAKGDKGDKGDQGAAGAKCDVGAKITSIELTITGSTISGTAHLDDESTASIRSLSSGTENVLSARWYSHARLRSAIISKPAAFKSAMSLGTVVRCT